MKRILMMSLAIASASLAVATPGCGGGGGGDGPSTLHINTTRGVSADNPLWLAVQDGTGAWTRLTPSSPGSFSMDLADPSGAYGVAMVTLEDNKPVVRILQMTRSDGTDWNLSVGSPNGSAITLSPVGVAANAMWRGSMWTYDSSTEGNFAIYLDRVPAGNRDCLAALYPQGLTNPPSRMIVHRNHEVSGPQAVTLDFNSAEAFAPELFTIQAPGAVTNSIVNVSLYTGNGAVLRTGQVTDTGKYAALPASKRAAGDLYVAYGGEEIWPNKVRLEAKTFRTPGDKTLIVPDTLGSASVAQAGAASMKAMWSPYAGASLYEITYEYEGTRSRAMSSRDWIAFVSPRWLGANRVVNLEYTIPDLRAVTGWSAAWNLDVTTAMEWTVGAYKANVSPAAVLGGVDRGIMIPLLDGADMTYTAILGHTN